MKPVTCLSALLVALCVPAMAAQDRITLKEDPVHVRTWNRFAADLYKLHKALLKGRAIETVESTGGYSGYLGSDDFYRQVEYYDAEDRRLLSRIQWERERTDRIHAIEVYVYGKAGKLQRDYLAAYLPHFRNAPIQTLINFHRYNDKLHAFRQFDASGYRIYEQCRGEYFGEPVLLSLEMDQIPDQGELDDEWQTEVYRACFEGLPIEAGKHLHPLVELGETGGGSAAYTDVDEAEREIARLSAGLAVRPKDARLYLARADAHLQLHNFEAAIADYSQALALDESLDDAYFGRGMARGRAGQIEEGIADLSVYIERHPDSSRAYTKRGVRQIWAGNWAQAKQDLSRAVVLDPDNAEAHDDLGVVFAREGDYAQAIAHFTATIRLDPSYQKAHHNLAMVYHLIGRHAAARDVIDEALRLRPQSQNSMLLKAEILAALGEREKAAALREEASFLPDENWSEVADL